MLGCVPSDVWEREVEKERSLLKEKRFHKLAQEIADLVFWGISVAGCRKEVRVHLKEKK